MGLPHAESRHGPAGPVPGSGWRRRWFPAIAGTFALGIAGATARGRGRALDHRLFKSLNSMGGPTSDVLFGGMTDLGSWGASLGAAVGLWAGGRRREGLDALGAASVTWGLAQLLKAAVLRPRPYHALQDFRVLITRPSSSTWPSAHPAVVLAFVTVASRNLGATRGVKASLLALASAVGVSRVYLGVHYPADVAGGLLLGRGVADLWSSAVSPKTIRRLPAVAVPLE